jgi:selenocysteine-specific elongation factor
MNEKHVTIGIAGHVDHGKTSLVKCLTGTDTDRLQEEKRRGLSIESGIAPFQSNDTDVRMAFVDVPGHTDFLKNTIRGLSSVDMAILVIAADDGLMPQTLAHLHILNFFDVKNGFVVLSKCDLADDEILYLAELEIREALEGTFLDEKPIMPFSVIDKTGLHEIEKCIVETAREIQIRESSLPFRLWIDQVKSFDGIGTVVTGTIQSGTLNQGDPLHLLPAGIETRARLLEMHHDKADKAVAGQRVGINIPKVPVKDVKRGMVLSGPDAVHPTYLLNVEIRLLENAGKPVKNRQRVKLYLGTSVTNAMIVFMEQEYLYPGGKGFAQVRLMKPVPALPGDPFVIGILNIQAVIGGGRVLQICREKIRRNNVGATLSLMKAVQENDIKAFVTHIFKLKPSTLMSSRKLARCFFVDEAAIEKEILKGVRSGKIILFEGQGFFEKTQYQALKKQVPSVVKMILTDNPLKVKVSHEEIKDRLSPRLNDAPFQRMVSELLNEKKIIKTGGGFQVPDYTANLSSGREKLIVLLENYAQMSWLVPFSAHTFWTLHKKDYSLNEVQRMLDYLYLQKRLIRLNNRRFISHDAMAVIKERVKNLIRLKGGLTIEDGKEVLGYGRTVGISVFEYLDSIKFTRRKDDMRILTDSDIEKRADA